ncbi:MAG TPA: YhzD family protein, partial [Candidatus Angelobacter sp.]|nr:YhzD family protein [Candidatus Angelobacter sp.]
MPIYTLTAFDQEGKKLVDETFEAADDQTARTQGEARLEELGFADKTSRVISPVGKLVHF